MNLAIGRSHSGETPAWIDATEFAEVVYRTDGVLIVSVAVSLAEDTRLTGALMDVIATSERYDVAESAISALAGDLDLDVRLGRGRGERHLTIAPRFPAEL